MKLHPSARCGSCGGRVLESANGKHTLCPICNPSWLSDNRADRLTADGIEISASGGALSTSDLDAPALLMLARVVRRLGVVAVVNAIGDGAATIVDMAADRDSLSPEPSASDVAQLREIDATMRLAKSRVRA